MWGPAAKPGDQARISQILIKNDRIHFEINGGPVKKEKWYQHIQFGGGGGMTPVAPSDANANPRGSYVDLVFDSYVPELEPQQLKDLLRPVFDFNAKSAVEAYLDTLPPKIRDAIKSHQVLVGMNREMVHCFQRPASPRKSAKKMGTPNTKNGSTAIRRRMWTSCGSPVTKWCGVEIMKVNGEKIIRTEKEVDLEQPTVAKGSSLRCARPMRRRCAGRGKMPILLLPPQEERPRPCRPRTRSVRTARLLRQTNHARLVESVWTGVSPVQAERSSAVFLQ